MSCCHEGLRCIKGNVVEGGRAVGVSLLFVGVGLRLMVLECVGSKYCPTRVSTSLALVSRCNPSDQ